MRRALPLLAALALGLSGCSASVEAPRVEVTPPQVDVDLPDAPDLPDLPDLPDAPDVPGVDVEVG